MWDKLRPSRARTLSHQFSKWTFVLWLLDCGNTTSVANVDCSHGRTPDVARYCGILSHAFGIATLKRDEGYRRLSKGWRQVYRGVRVSANGAAVPLWRCLVTSRSDKRKRSGYEIKSARGERISAEAWHNRLIDLRYSRDAALERRTHAERNGGLIASIKRVNAKSNERLPALWCWIISAFW